MLWKAVKRNKKVRSNITQLCTKHHEGQGQCGAVYKTLDMRLIAHNGFKFDF
jgi:hypothetical protein